MALSKQDREETVDIIKLTVNGKIDALRMEVKDHIDKVEPYMKAASGIQVLWRLLLGIAAFAIALDQIWNSGIIGATIGRFLM